MPVLKQHRVTIKLIERVQRTTEVQAQEVRQEVIVHHLQQNRVLDPVLLRVAAAVATEVVEVAAVVVVVHPILVVQVAQEVLVPAVVQEVVRVQVHHLLVEDDNRIPRIL